MKIKIFLVSVILFTIAIFIFNISTNKETEGQTNRSGTGMRISRRKPANVKQLVEIRDTSIKVNTLRREKRKVDRSQIPDEVSPQDRRLFDEVDKALNAEDFTTVQELAKLMGNSTNEIVRLRAIEALGWFNEEALPELTPFLVDQDENVRDAAQDLWLSALGQVEDERVKATIIEATMGVIKDRDMLEDIAFNLNELSTFTAIESVVALINSENPDVVDVALESYSFLTGEEYTTFEAAQAWVNENIDLSEESDDIPVYRASLHPEVFDPEIDISGMKIINDTEYDIPERKNFDKTISKEEGQNSEGE
ncbi:MAG: HEAT repeat domain-containing protein [Kiritimatiellae bacterium]|nr:HEAT repeat domain-containing protein [Kiritimatiellia bacterium]